METEETTVPIEETTVPIREILNAVHFNSNKMAALSIKTTGPDPMKHQIIEICIYVMTSNYKQAKTILPFHVYMRPDLFTQGSFGDMHIGKDEFNNVHLQAPSPEEQFTLFTKWYDSKVKLKDNKKLIPVCYDWLRVGAFLRKWMGPLNFEYYFDTKQPRDLQSIIMHRNDRADIYNQKIPFPRLDLQYAFTKYKIPSERYANCILETNNIIILYDKMVHEYLPL